MSRKKPDYNSPDTPLLHHCHKRPVTRREFLGAGLVSGSAIVMAPTIVGSMLNSRKAHALVDPADVASVCGIGAGAGNIPFIAFDLGGGANTVGSNVMIGGAGGQLNLISAAGYEKLGLPSNMLPSSAGANINTDLGLAFHSDSSFLRGILSKTSTTTRANVNGAVIPARSDNDTSTNPHNPMYGIAKAGASGELLDLIGSANSDSGGRSVAPMSMMDPTLRPTQVASPTDATGLVDTGDLGSLMPDTNEAGRVMEAIEGISKDRIGNRADALPTTPMDPTDVSSKSLQDLVHCGYLKTSDTVTRFGDINDFNPLEDSFIHSGATVNPLQDPTTFSNTDTTTAVTAGIANTQAIFSAGEMGDGMKRKTASIMKLVNNGLAGAGTIEQGGYDYHTGTRAPGEVRDFRAGQCIGACLEYAARLNTPIMIYLFSDGSVASNGNISDGGDPDSRGKPQWTGDNSSTAAAFFLVYNPGGRPVLMGGTQAEQDTHQQLGYFRTSGSVETNGTTPGANNVNLLVEMIILNYLALHDRTAEFETLFPGHGLGAAGQFDRLIAFNPLS